MGLRPKPRQENYLKKVFLELSKTFDDKKTPILKDFCCELPINLAKTEFFLFPQSRHFARNSVSGHSKFLGVLGGFLQKSPPCRGLGLRPNVCRGLGQRPIGISPQRFQKLWVANFPKAAIMIKRIP